jgi:hypothetical protein
MTVELVTERPVHANVYDPTRPSIFGKPAANARAETQVVYCKLAACPLRDAGCCTLRAPMFPDRCPYGRIGGENGPTKRAVSFRNWVTERKEKFKDVPYLKSAPKKLAFIGDYVYLPYAHMTMCKTVDFLSHSAFIVSGNPFLPRGCWKIDAVLRLIDFRPKSMMGGEITSYQTEEVPLFIQHLREGDAAMWAELIAARPELDTAPNYVGRKALLRTLNAPLTLPAKDSRYPVEWTWDGERVRTTSRHAYSSTWGGFDLGELELSAVPAERAVIEVRDNSWVCETTEFVD